MKNLIVTAFVFSVIALGMESIRDAITFKRWREKRKAKKADKGGSSIYVVPEMAILFKALSNAGYVGPARVPEPFWVDDPMIADMVEAIAAKHPLMWVLPAHGLRFRPMPAEAPEELRVKYRSVLLTRTHVIGYGRITEGV